MQDAVQAHIIARNPTEGATIPRQGSGKKQVLNDRELDTFLAVIEKDEIWHDFFYTELTTGLRRGEICSLMWRDFDGKAGTLKVCRTLHSKKLGVSSLGDTKTGMGTRTIVLPHSTLELLRQRKKNSISQWIFPNPIKPELPTSPNSAYNHLKTLLKQAKLPDIRFHDLRHTFATHAIASGVDAKTLSGILGHTNASFTLDTYTHDAGRPLPLDEDLPIRALSAARGEHEGLCGEPQRALFLVHAVETKAATAVGAAGAARLQAPRGMHEGLEEDLDPGPGHLSREAQRVLRPRELLAEA